MIIQWYPGHMAKTKRELKEILPLLDLVLEVADARLPESSRNPELNKLLGNKQRILLLNKVDLADTKSTNKWLEYYRTHGVETVGFNALTGEGETRLNRLLEDKFTKLTLPRKHLRLGVVGIPNTGKSSVLNRLVKRSVAQVGNKPGVTKGRQWVKRGKWEILDTPGLLWPKIESPEKGWLLAFIGTIKPELLDHEELALRLLEFLTSKFPGRIQKFYGVEEQGKTEDILGNIGKSRGCLVKGGQIDTLRTADLLWNDFRGGRLGKFTLEDPTLFSV